MQDSLLIELLTEELPPKSLRLFGAEFANWVHSGLADLGFLSGGEATSFATPRRIAITITNVEDHQFEQEVTRKGPSVAAALNRAGEPTQALIGFAKSRGVGVEALKRVRDAKGEFFVFRTTSGGEPLERHLAGVVEAALKQLSIPKLMRWGDGNFEFARPVRGLIMLYGKRVVSGSVLGVSSGRTTIGHRFLGKSPIVIPEADQYEALLEKDGKVIPHLHKRFQKTKDQLREKAAGAIIGADDDLIDEVAALVEYPVVYAGEFDPAFLVIPQECLVLSMEQHQRYFPLLHKDGTLLPRFLMVANVDPDNPQDIIRGNERVLRARLSDAKFFFDQDRKVRLEDRVPQLATVVYHNKLGSQLERVERITRLSEIIAEAVGADMRFAQRAARLSKADLTTEMVAEFPELQGVMGRYYALHDGEPTEVAEAIEQHYWPRFAGDSIPSGKIAVSVALADKILAISSLFRVNERPTGDKDPLGLRRQALGVLRILIEHHLPLDLEDLIRQASSLLADPRFAESTNLEQKRQWKERTANARGFRAFGTLTTSLAVSSSAVSSTFSFFLDRLRGYLREQGYSANEVEAVLCLNPQRIDLVPRQLAAVRAFASLPEAESLTAANKRVVNILKQAEAKGESFATAESAALREPNERELFNALAKTAKAAAALFASGDFEGYLKSFAVLKTPVDAFFDSVMVMVEDESLRRNRLALLADLRREMNRVADISKLAA